MKPARVKAGELSPGSVAWHAHRAGHFNASEAPAAVEVNPWFPHDQFELYQLKTGAREVVSTPAMRRGLALEAAARAAYERETGLIVQPQVVTRGRLSASLDGIDFDGRRVVEIKCPSLGPDQTLDDLGPDWRRWLDRGEAPPHYYWQIQHQLLCAGARFADLWVFDGVDGVRIAVPFDADAASYLEAQWAAFAGYFDQGVAPPPTDRCDAEFAFAAELYRVKKAQLEAAQAELEAAKGELLALCTTPRTRGFGVTVTRSPRRGPVDYAAVPELAGVDLEPYRKPPYEAVTVSVGRESQARDAGE